MLYFRKKKLNVNFPKSLFTYIRLHLTHKKVSQLKKCILITIYVKVAAQLPYNWLFN